MKFKLTNKSRALLAAGVFLIAVISLSMVQMQQIQARSRTEREMAQTSVLIEKLTGNGLASQKTELESRIETTKTDIAQAQDHLRQSLETIESSGEIYDIAAQSYVNIVRLDSSTLSEKEVGDVKGALLQVTVKAEGTMVNLINFVSGLTTKYHTGTVTSLEINTSKTSEGISDNASGTLGPVETSQITVVLTIYDYRGE